MLYCTCVPAPAQRRDNATLPQNSVVGHCVRCGAPAAVYNEVHLPPDQKHAQEIIAREALQVQLYVKKTRALGQACGLRCWQRWWWWH